MNISKPQLYPLTFTPVLKDYLWGGRNLEKIGRALPPGITAESWEIAAHPHGTTIVENGPFAGWRLSDVQSQWGLDLIGRKNEWAHNRGKFPLLIKLLDADQPLSVQVHPDDAYALHHEGNELGKTEMWVVLDARPGAKIVLGVKEGTTAAILEQAITEGTVESLLHHIPVKRGDYVCVPAGSLHAILGGVLIAEIQQNSDTTYRVYDWNRLDQKGQSRALHVKQSLAVINFEQIEPGLPAAQILQQTEEMTRYKLCRNRYFNVERVEMVAGARFSGELSGETLEIWGLLQGNASLLVGAFHQTLRPVRFVLLPAALGCFEIISETPATLLRVYVE